MSPMEKVERLKLTGQYAEIAKRVDVARIAADGHPLLQRVVRNETFSGVNMIVPVMDPVPTLGASPDIPNWCITRSSDHERARFDANSPTQMVSKLQMAAMMLGDRLARALFVPVKSRFGGAWHATDNCVDSLNGWVPETGPRPDDNWKGINRSVDQQRLAGLRLNVSGMPANEAFHEADARAEVEGSDADEPFFMHPKTYDGLAKRDRRLTMVQDDACPENVVWRLPDDHLSLVSCGAMPHLSNFDGNVVMQTETPGELEARVCFYGNTVLRNPGHVVRVMGLELQKKVSVQVPDNFIFTSANVAAGSIAIAPQSRGLNWNPLGVAPHVADHTSTLVAQRNTAVVVKPDRACPNKTCMKPNDAASTKCWMCECEL